MGGQRRARLGRGFPFVDFPPRSPPPFSIFSRIACDPSRTEVLGIELGVRNGSARGAHFRGLKPIALGNAGAASLFYTCGEKGARVSE